MSAKTKYVFGRGHVALRPWEVCLANGSDAALVRFMRALFATSGHFTDSHSFGTPDRYTSVGLMVWLPDGHLAKFREVAKPYEVRHTKCIQVGQDGYRCGVEGCADRCPPGHHGGTEWREVRRG